MECPCCGDRLDEKGYCENCGYTVGDELPTPSAGAPVVEENQPTQFVDGEVSYTERKVKKCPTCGAECIEEDKFCSACGHSFDGTKKQPAPTNDFAAATNAFSGATINGSSQTANVPQRRCGVCGKFVAKTARSCSYCGTSFLAVTASSVSKTVYAPPKQPTYTPPKQPTYTSSQSSYTPPKSKRTNGYAIAALVFVLIAWTWGWIPGLILSKKALRFADFNDGSGRGMAKAARVIATIEGIIIGLLAFVMCTQTL